MKKECPECGGHAAFFLSIVYRNDNFRDGNKNWKVKCDCGLEREGSFSPTTRIVAILLYLTPIVLLWGAFLFYGGGIRPAWLSLVVWLLHIVPGVLVGDMLSGEFASHAALKNIQSC